MDAWSPLHIFKIRFIRDGFAFADPSSTSSLTNTGAARHWYQRVGIVASDVLCSVKMVSRWTSWSGGQVEIVDIGHIIVTSGFLRNQENDYLLLFTVFYAE
jgi:hypothetical protein